MKLHYLLDTDTCIYIIRKKPPQVLERFQDLSPGELGISVITYGELFTGCEKSQQPEIAHEKLKRFIELVEVQAMTAETGAHYGTIRGILEKAGTPMGNNDLWIAAHALSLNVTLVSNNEREFRRVPRLAIENWVVSS